MPEEDLAALLNPPDYLAGIEDGSQEDSVEAFGNQDFDNETTNRFQQALTSTQVVKTFENKPIRIPGFIVPLESSESQMVTEFFYRTLLRCMHSHASTTAQSNYLREY